MSLMIEAMIIGKYGFRLDVKQLAEAISSTPASIRQRIHDGTFEIPTYVDGGKRFADYRDVAEHFEKCRSKALGIVA